MNWTVLELLYATSAEGIVKNMEGHGYHQVMERWSSQTNSGTEIFQTGEIESGSAIDCLARQVHDFR